MTELRHLKIFSETGDFASMFDQGFLSFYHLKGTYG